MLVVGVTKDCVKACCGTYCEWDSCVCANNCEKFAKSDAVSFFLPSLSRTASISACALASQMRRRRLSSSLSFAASSLSRISSFLVIGVGDGVVVLLDAMNLIFSCSPLLLFGSGQLPRCFVAISSGGFDINDKGDNGAVSF